MANISGSLKENLDINLWEISTFNFLSKELISNTIVDTDISQTYSIDLVDTTKVYLVLTPKYNLSRSSSVAVALNDIIIPEKLSDNPYLFRCIQAGTTSSDEFLPFWNLYGITSDNIVHYEYIGLFPPPVVHGPITPI